MFEKILIANRGEIACRIIDTARRLGIRTVAVHSQVDAQALHVEMADEAVPIGGAAASDSYLVIERIVDACRTSGAQAVHPGYGFLSENPKFVAALEAAGIVFIGPPQRAIEIMGDKIQSKRFAEAAGVPIVPGHPDVVESADDAVRIADDIGYPVMIKASAGGGGKGMRVAHDAGKLREGYERARSEAASSFGDDRVFVERFIEEPRHIEIQVLADGHGNVVHLGERECSIQRRNQKVVEEAPSAFVDVSMRDRMGRSAVALAEAVGYQSAGTVEFIVDAERNFYFLEMNTRLQVEHPVTELVTGLDLVEEMIRVAAGDPLRMVQDDVVLKGHAVECRVYAEDPYRDFLPSIGRLRGFRPPEETSADGTTVRNDTGVVEGSEISIHYDPMIAKLVTHAASRSDATAAMMDALDRFAIGGIRHNIPFLQAIMAHPRWHEGRLSTGFIAQEFPAGFTGIEPGDEAQRILACIALAVELETRRGLLMLADRLDRPTLARTWIVRADGWELPVERREGPMGKPLAINIVVAGEAPVRVASDWRPGEPVWKGRIGEETVFALVERHGHRLTINRRGATASLRVLSARIADLDSLMPEKQLADTSGLLLCPMPGLVVELHVEVGREVAPGEPLATIEAMKMENVLRAERAATIAAIHVKPGDSLSVDDVILEFETGA